MGAKELYDAGNLSGAIEQLVQDVRSSPRDVRSRTFLFELLCFSGDFDRAERQLDAIAQVSGEATVEIGVQIYRNVIAAEKVRNQFFKKGTGQPKFLSEPPPYAALHLQAINLVRENRLDEADGLLEEALGISPTVRGQADSTPFESVRDCDDLVGPFLEAIFQRDYVWLPFEQLKQIEVQAPRTLRDLLWIPARAESSQGKLGDLFLPVNYHGSSEHSNDLIKLGRMTEWLTAGEQFSRGMGQRMLFLDDRDQPLLQIRKLEISQHA